MWSKIGIGAASLIVGIFLSIGIWQCNAAESKSAPPAAAHPAVQPAAQPAAPAAAATERPEPVRIAILEFTNIDRLTNDLLKFQGRELSETPVDSLNAADRKSMDPILQGYVRMIDARDNAEARQYNRELIMAENEREWQRRLLLYEQVANSVNRPVVLGADYMAGAMGPYSDVMVVSSPGMTTLAAALSGKDSAAGTLKFWQSFADSTGVDCLLYGTVSDLRTKTKTFKGYGIEITRKIFELDLLVKVVDVRTQRTVFSCIATGTSSQNETANLKEENPAIFADLMTGAVRIAAEEMNTYFSQQQKDVQP